MKFRLTNVCCNGGKRIMIKLKLTAFIIICIIAIFGFGLTGYKQ